MIFFVTTDICTTFQDSILLVPIHFNMTLSFDILRSKVTNVMLQKKENAHVLKRVTLASKCLQNGHNLTSNYCRHTHSQCEVL